ncbi:MAG: DUF4846 domain-containing protein [Flavobacteriales bacterium]
MKAYPLLFFIVLPFVQCGKASSEYKIKAPESGDAIARSSMDTSGRILLERFNVPENYERTQANPQDFCFYLRNLPLKPAVEKVRYFDGGVKEKENVYAAVVDLPIGNRDLHQCADAVMRLRAEYLWHQGRYDEIHFNYTNGFRSEYSRWMKGDRILFDSGKVFYQKLSEPSNTAKDLWKYLEQVFTYCGTLSLSKELKPIEVLNIEPGDVFIKGGSPGHAVIVLDVARNKNTGKKIFLLGQSYMPAQEIQILINPNNSELSPWYSADFGEVLYTPEWTFQKNQLMRFP